MKADRVLDRLVRPLGMGADVVELLDVVAACVPISEQRATTRFRSLYYEVDWDQSSPTHATGNVPSPNRPRIAPGSPSTARKPEQGRAFAPSLQVRKPERRSDF